MLQKYHIFWKQVRWARSTNTTPYVPIPYPDRTQTRCTYPLYLPTVCPRTDAYLVPNFWDPGHEIEHNT